MREATLGGLSAIDDTRPRKAGGKPAAPARGKAKPREGRWARFRRLRSRITLIVGSAGFSAIMIGIVLNATVMQKGHHPAPLFVGATAPAPVAPPVVPQPEASAPPAAIPAPAPDPIAALAEPPPVQAAAPPPAHAAKPAPKIAKGAKPTPARADDSIARMLGSSGSQRPAANKAAHPKPAAASPLAQAPNQPMALHPKAPAKTTNAAVPPKRSIPIAAKDRAPLAVN